MALTDDRGMLTETGLIEAKRLIDEIYADEPLMSELEAKEVAKAYIILNPRTLLTKAEFDEIIYIHSRVKKETE